MAELVDARDLKSVLSFDFIANISPPNAVKPIENHRKVIVLHNQMAVQTYTYRWDRQGRKGQACRVTARGKFNSIRVEFEDGFEMITSGNAIRKVAALPPSPIHLRSFA